MKVTEQLKPGLAKIKEKASRTSLTLFLSIFVFVILLSAVSLAALGLWILTRVGVLVDGELQLGSIILFVTVISVVLGAVITYFSSKIPLRPFNELINKMNRLAAGDFKVRLEFGPSLSSHPAIMEIIESFNTMAKELESTELLRADFINDFSHEFKTPIASITGFAKLLSRGELTEEQRAEYIKCIEEESVRLSAMATNVLALTRVENQTILTDITSYNLAEQLRSSVLLLEEKWTRKHIELELELDELSVEASEELMRQVFINLLDNAIKFSPDGGKVSISLHALDGMLYASISNTGEAIPSEKLEKIFNKFYQADESHATQGNGIGLAIVKRIVELHRGEIHVECRGGVTTFTVALAQTR